MTWTRVDDGFYDNPKVLAVGNAGAGLYVRALAYCNKHLTDGVLADSVVTLLAGPDGHLPDALARAGLWVREDGGYRVPDFLDFNPSAESVRKKRKEDADRKSSSRACPKGVRADSGRSPTVPSRPVPSPSQNPPTPVPGEVGVATVDAPTELDAVAPSGPTEGPGGPADAPAGTAPAFRLVEPRTGPQDVGAGDTLAAQAREVFEHWRAVMGKPARAVFAGKREAKVRARLNEGRTVDELKRAIDGCKRSPHHMGENDTRTVYDDLELICRDSTKVDFFLAKTEAAPAKPVTRLPSLDEAFGGPVVLRPRFPKEASNG